MENPARSLGTMSALANSDVSPLPEPDQERHAATSCAGGFLIRPPRKPHLLATETTPEEELFLAIHMGVVDVDKSQWLLVIDGLVRRPFALTYQQLRAPALWKLVNLFDTGPHIRLRRRQSPILQTIQTSRLRVALRVQAEYEAAHRSMLRCQLATVLLLVRLTDCRSIRETH
jgi:hypothetical protein